MSTLRQATSADIGAIVGLVNRAFEVERFFKSGDRTDVQQIRALLDESTFLLLQDGTTLIACLQVKQNCDRVYIGLLAVEPSRQKSGIARRMMHEGENFGRAAGCKFADLRVVSVRPELPLIYRKLGYAESGTESAAVITTATMPVHFIKMSKPL
jgi:predicted N-acetyltransferase YhbS